MTGSPEGLKRDKNRNEMTPAGTSQSFSLTYKGRAVAVCGFNFGHYAFRKMHLPHSSFYKDLNLSTSKSEQRHNSQNTETCFPIFLLHYHRKLLGLLQKPRHHSAVSSVTS